MIPGPAWLPDKDFATGNLSRRQVLVFEHLCALARAGLQAQIDSHEAAADPNLSPYASDTVRQEHLGELWRCRRDLDRVAALHNRLKRLRQAPLTASERVRVARARQVKEGLTAAEADLVIYGMLDPEQLAERRAA